MRFFSELINDIKYQIKYGFYFLYLFISAIYVAILLLCPSDIRQKIASIIILTDPVMLGMFFIGGIWLLEKNEGLHRFLTISPLKTMEYILSKVVSLSIISTLSAVIIALIGLNSPVNILGLIIYVFVGSMNFTALGLFVSSYSRSVNHYMLIASLPATILTSPAILAAFFIYNPILNILPSIALWHGISYSLRLTEIFDIWSFVILILWFLIILLVSNVRISIALKAEGGEKI